jgi:hypothetical protein
MELAMLKQLAQHGPKWIPGEAYRRDSSTTALVAWALMEQLLSDLEK